MKQVITGPVLQEGRGTYLLDKPFVRIPSKFVTDRPNFLTTPIVLKPKVHYWFAGKSYTLTYRIIPPMRGFSALGKLNNNEKIKFFIDIENPDTALLFKLTWGGK